MLEVEWDEAKRLSNLRKHGADLADVPFLDWDNATVLEDTRFDYSDHVFGHLACCTAGCISWPTAFGVREFA